MTMDTRALGAVIAEMLRVSVKAGLIDAGRVRLVVLEAFRVSGVCDPEAQRHVEHLVEQEKAKLDVQVHLEPAEKGLS